MVSVVNRINTSEEQADLSALREKYSARARLENIPDAKLLANLRSAKLAGNQQMVNDLMHVLNEVYNERLIRTLRKRFNFGRQQAEDVVQDTFLYIFRAIDKFRPERNQDVYISVVANSRALDSIRREKYRTSKISVESGSPTITERLSVVAATRGSVLSELVSKEEQAMLKKAMLYSERLSREHFGRPSYYMSYINGMSYNEIAQKHNIPVGTVKSRMSADKKILFDHLRKIGWYKPEVN